MEQDSNKNNTIHATREDGSSFHVRLSPSPPNIIRTNSSIHDRLEILVSSQQDGIYRRVSKSFLATLESERDRQEFPSEKRDRLNRIIALAMSVQNIPQDDLMNSPAPDVNWGCKFG